MKRSSKPILQPARDIITVAHAMSLGCPADLAHVEFPHIHITKLRALYWEVNGKPSPKGVRPWHEGWFERAEQCIHASVYERSRGWFNPGLLGTCQAFEEYLSRCEDCAVEPVLAFQRVWTLERMLASNVLTHTHCKTCFGGFVTAPIRALKEYHCPACRPPNALSGKRFEFKKLVSA